MIAGIGTDLVEIARLEQAVQRTEEAFLKTFLTPEELAEGASRKKAAMSYYAGRWAAKEAVAKMLGCGFGAKCQWQDIRVLDNASGAPEVELTGKAAETAAGLGIARIFLSISHEHAYALAFAVGETEEPKS